MRQYEIAIVSFGDDMHALIIQKALEKYDDLKCHIIQSDRLSGSAVLSWSNIENDNFISRLPARGGYTFDLSMVNVIWWRRAVFRQQIPSTITDPAHIDLIDTDCRVAVTGILLNEFRGRWIDHPVDTALAENKLVQLQTARHAGFRVPDTLVSQDPTLIRDFCERLDYKVIVKPVKGTRKAQLFTNMVTPANLACEESIALCPAIYQEYIPGDRHVRVQCFGDDIYSVIIKSQNLDWRGNISVPLEVIELEEDVKRRLRKILTMLRLKMGVIDLKFTPDDELVWFEINPQGQFLFVEGLTGLDLTSAFSNFLYQEARQSVYSNI